MKVALISTFCLESTIPLAKYLEEKSLDVQLYAIVPKNNQNIYVVDFSNNKQPLGFINDGIANLIMGQPLFNYLKKVKTTFFVMYGSGRKNLFSDIYYCWKLSKHIKKRKFQIVHLIHTYGRISYFLLYFLRKQNVIQTLHEVTAHDGASSKIDLKIFSHLIKKNIPVIFHSNTSKSRFLSLREKIVPSNTFNSKLYAMIRFGLFETYKLFELEEKKEIIKSSVEKIPVILHFGRILPYKGIDILIEAVKIVQKKQPVHLIIAGSGNPYFSFDGLDSYEFINRNLTNLEITQLIKKSIMIVCPYKSASQSGIPMTVFVFNKPIIASNVGGFMEVIQDNKNGKLINSFLATDFSETILNVIKDHDLINNIEKNIKNKFDDGEYSWSQIAQNTLEFYKKSLVN